MKMNRKTLCLGMLAAAGSASAQTPENPNIVLILADDLGWCDVGYHGSTIRTPNIDKLAKKGIELNRYYTAPISSPARAGILTGRYPNRFGFRTAVIPPWRKDGLDKNERTIADVLGENGYANRAVLGKWHLGHTYSEHYPMNRGFTHFYGCLNGALDYFTHLREGELDWHNDWESCYDQGYTTDLICDEAVKCINEYSKSGSPYFIYTAFNAPHTPLQVPEEEIWEYISKEEYDQLKANQQKGYIYKAMVSRLDKAIGKILQALEESGQMENTIVMFMSDNGGVDGMTDGSSCLPLRGHKFQEWDGGVRVPAVIYWEKGFKNGGRKIDEVVGFVDILPTIADIIGVTEQPERPYDGISVSSLLKGTESHLERDLYLGCGAVVNKDWKLILKGKSGSMKINADYLVDYSIDPYEKRNNMAGNEDIAEELKKIAICYDTITPAVKEVPYDYGKNGFVAPKEWKVENKTDGVNIAPIDATVEKEVVYSVSGKKLDNPDSGVNIVKSYLSNETVRVKKVLKR